MVIDFSRDGTNANAFSPAEVAAMANGPGGEKVMVAYISIGEASDFRDEWNSAWTTTGKATGKLTPDAPDWLGPVNPDWPESRKVRYWDTGWQDLIFNDQHDGWLDRIVASGFDAAYLDIVDAYYYWAVEAPANVRQPGDPALGDEKEAAKRMIDFIVDMTAHAREINPDFFVILQNGDFIIDALEVVNSARKTALLDAIGGIAVEDVYFGGGKDENNSFNPDEDRIAVLKRDFLGNGKFVLSVDYVNQPSKMTKFIAAAVEDGFMPFIARDRDLDRLSPALGTAMPTAGDDVWLGGSSRDVFDAATGNDVFNGMAGNDVLRGGAGADTIFGDRGADRINGGGGSDTLSGGKGNDRLWGGADTDTFVFAKGGGSDTIKDFQDGIDRLQLEGFGTSVANILAHATTVDGHLEINFANDTLVVFGLTRATLSADDLLLLV
jgi:cysteinyl-tRNA synthetase